MNNSIITRDDAQARRLKRYFTGELCIRGHRAERYTSTGACVSCLLRTVPDAVKPEFGAFVPLKPFVFQRADIPAVSEVEAQAVFRWMAASGWHFAALKFLRDDPALMARFDHEMTLAEKFETGRDVPDPLPTVKR